MAEENISFSPSSDGAVAKSNLAFAKIVSFPKPSSWSQVYNAGRLFAVLSLKSDKSKEQEDPDLLSHVGRSFLDRLEEEFFTIETKNLLAIKQAVATALQNLPEGIASSMALAVFNNSVLYLFAKGGAKVFIKRNGKFGTILDSENLDPKSITSSSGPLEDNDLITLCTKSFLDIIDPPFLSSALENLAPIEISETLTPKVHEKEEGAAAAFIIKYVKQGKAPEESSYSEEAKKTEEKKEHKKFSHSKKVYLTVALLILTILSFSIFFALKKQNDTKTQAIFKDIYASALKKYEEGSSLLDLNSNLAKENLLASKELLQNYKNKFKENSKEQEQILTLLKKADEGLEKVEESNNSSFFLKTQINPSAMSDVAPAGRPKASFFTQDENYVYILNESGISSLDKKNGQVKVLIKSNSWKTPAGIGAYLGNLYVIDKDLNQILKFVNEGDGFTKSNYFSNSQPDLSNAISMSIDGSIWILFKDGSIQKFIKGTKDTFDVSGLKKPFANSTKIFTDKNTDSLYILDNGNSRIVVLGKDGKYRSEYSLDAIKNAKDFEVLEKDKKILVLSENKIHEIEIK